MLKIEKSVTISGSDQENLFAWVNDLRNWEKLMPSDRIENWSADENSCELNLKGLAHLKLQKTDSETHSVKVINPDEKPFSISIAVHIEEAQDGLNKVRLNFEGQMNAFIKAMAETPLNNFIEGIGTNFKQIIEGN